MSCSSLLFLLLVSLLRIAAAQNAPTPQGVRGTIFSIDRDRGAVRLRVAEGEYVTVEMHARTAFRHDRGEALTFADLRVGDVVAAVGEQRERYFLADEVRVMAASPSEAPSQRPTPTGAASVIEGTVRRPTRTITRKLGFRTQQENLTVDVPKDAVIIKEYKRISVHELASGDRSPPPGPLGRPEALPRRAHLRRRQGGRSIHRRSARGQPSRRTRYAHRGRCAFSRYRPHAPARQQWSPGVYHPHRSGPGDAGNTRGGSERYSPGRPRGGDRQATRHRAICGADRDPVTSALL